MEKKDFGNPFGPSQEKSLISFINKLPTRKDLREDPHYKEREEFWEMVVKKQMETLNKGKMNEEKFCKNISSLITFKEFGGDNDSITGLPNQRSFNKNLEKEIARSKREKSDLSLLVIDIDDMKSFNNDGHSIGNLAIENTGRTLFNAVREGDFVARWAGDEFTVILPHTEEKTALMVAQRILEKIKKVDIFAPSGKKLSVSIGIKQWKGEDGKNFFKEADKALMNKAKKSPEKIAILR